MTEREAASIKIVTDPLLPIARLLELRVFLDVLVSLSPRGESPPAEGGPHVQNDDEKAAAGSVHNNASGSSASSDTSRSREIAIGPAKGSRRKTLLTVSPIRSGGAS